MSLVLAVISAGSARAVTSSRSVTSAFGGNGHNVSFDGRLYITRTGGGWEAQILRPEATTYLGDGLPDAMGPMWSGYTTLLAGDVVENALAICEPDHDRAPFRCDVAGNATSSGAFDCYDLVLFDSDAVTPSGSGGAILRRRTLMVWVAEPKSATAHIDHFAFGPSVTNLSPVLKGIEPTMTADGKLMVWQGHPANDGQIDILMYSVNANACAGSSWSAPKVISSMATDPKVNGIYRIGERTLRAADGATFAAGDLVHGAYPWIMANGDAIIFTGAPMPCRGPEDPGGCGPRRNALSVIGYPTNWGVAHIDGGVNPSTADTVRLFFSSPGPAAFSQLPVTEGQDVWPFFGTNTSNYVELIFDDGLDGQYAGFWHLNESIDKAGDMDKGKTPDVSGYFNTGVLHGGMTFAEANDGVVGKALSFDGVDDRVEVAHAASLLPVNGITIDFRLRPQNPDCDANPNYRLLLGKGNLGAGGYNVIFEENGSLHARITVGGVEQELWGPPVPFDQWTHASFEYDGPTGKVTWFYDDVEVATATVAAGQLSQSNTQPLLIGGPGVRAACPNGDGAYAGQLDEVSVSRVARRTGTAAPEPDAGPAEEQPDAGEPGEQPDAGGPGVEEPGGGCCRSSGPGAGTFLIGLLVLLIAAGRRAAPAARRRRS